MDGKPLFSVLVAQYNNGNFFSDFYASILSQTYDNWEIIIVDDKSTDDSLNIIKSIIKENPKVKIFSNLKNKGCGYTKKRCIELADGEIMGFVDPDDKIVPNAIELMVEQHIKYPKSALIYSNHFDCDENFNVLYESKGYQVIQKDPYFFNIDAVIFHFTTFKKIFYNKTDKIDSYLKKAEDMDLYLKLYDIGDALFIEKTLYYYRWHDKGIAISPGNRTKARYWHWYAATNIARKRNIESIDSLFIKDFVRKYKYDGLVGMISRSRYIKLGRILGFLKHIPKL